MEIITKFIYNGGDFSSIKEQITETNCFEILSIANSIGMEELSDFIANHIGNQFLNKENCLKIYNDILNVSKVYLI